MSNPPFAEPAHIYITTASPEKFAELGSRFLDAEINDVQVISWGTELGATEWQEKMAARMMKHAR